MTDLPKPLRNGDLKKTLWIIALALFIIIKEGMIPLLNEVTGKSSQSGKIQSEQLADIQAKVNDLIMLTATNTEAISGLKVSFDRIDRKMDSHIMNDPRK